MPETPQRTIAAVGQTPADTMTRKPMREQAERKVNMIGILEITLKERYVSYTSKAFLLNFVALDIPYRSMNQASIARPKPVKMLLTAISCWVICVIWNPVVDVPPEVVEKMVASRPASAMRQAPTYVHSFIISARTFSKSSSSEASLSSRYKEKRDTVDSATDIVDSTLTWST